MRRFLIEVFLEQDYYHNLQKYIVIAAGMADLSSLTAGKNGDISPFNIAQTLYLTEIDDEEAEKLVTNPFNKVGVVIEQGAKDRDHCYNKISTIKDKKKTPCKQQNPSPACLCGAYMQQHSDMMDLRGAYMQQNIDVTCFCDAYMQQFSY